MPKRRVSRHVYESQPPMLWAIARRHTQQSQPGQRMPLQRLLAPFVIPAKRSASRDRKKIKRFNLLRSLIRLRLSGMTETAIRARSASSAWRSRVFCALILK